MLRRPLLCLYGHAARPEPSVLPSSSTLARALTSVTATASTQSFHKICTRPLPTPRQRYRHTDATAVQLRKTLGAPIPLNDHAVSVTMPKWQHVVGYEEGDADVTDKLVLGYPRFVYHPFVKQLVDVWKAHAVEVGAIAAHEVVGALPFPSLGTAERCRRFLEDAHAHEPGFPVNLHPVGVMDTYIVTFPSFAAGEAKAYWQHSGEILSSRKAARVLASLGHPVSTLVNGFPSAAPLSSSTSSSTVAATAVGEARPGCYRQALKERISALTGQREEDVYLTISGMAAIFKAFHICKQARPNRRVVVFGFTYLDTLKICLRKEWNSHGVHFLGRGDVADLKTLEGILKEEEIMAVFTEFPSNPLLQCPDLGKLTELGREYGFPVVVDDTISNFDNVDLMGAERGREGGGYGGIDMSVSSLTKLFSGKGDVMAGSLVLNGKSPSYKELRRAMEEGKEGGREGGLGDDAELYEEDAKVVWENGRDFEERSRRINETTRGLVEWLVGEEGVEEVSYPSRTQKEIYDRFRRREGGYGGLFSVSLKEGLSPTAFYDALDVYKGPSLGTNFTLACPYTLLAHYNELDFARSHGVCPNLVRVSVGLEGLESLKEAFRVALEAARKPLPENGLYFPPGLRM
ncbi:hypothetical protein VYU27_004969 [Nannochloropsis oceanica]